LLFWYSKISQMVTSCCVPYSNGTLQFVLNNAFHKYYWWNHNRLHKIISLFLYNYNTKFVENEQACNKSCNLTFPCPFAIWFLLFNKLKYYTTQKQQIPSFYHGPMHYPHWKIIKIIMFHLCFAPNNMCKKATYLNMPKFVSCLEITSWK
jgi:hypothetical protein